MENIVEHQQTHLNQLFRLGGLSSQRIVLFRALPGLGDMLCAVPALRALRAALPEAHLTLIGLPWAKTFVQRFHNYLDGFVEFPGYPGLPDREPLLSQIPAFLADVQTRCFDLAIQMHGNGSIINPLVVLLGARLSAGFFLPGQYCPDEEYFLPYPDHKPEVWRNLCLLEFLGIPNQGDSLEFPIYGADWQALFELEEVYRLRPGEYVCVHPGASTLERCWPPDRFAVVADMLASCGLQVVLTGTAREATLTEAVAQAMKTRPIDLTGRTQVGALATLLSKARLVVCNDTSVSHLAAALRVPSVVIFTQSDPARWAPLDRVRHRIVYEWRQESPGLAFRAIEEISRLQDNGHDAALNSSLKELSLSLVTPEMVLAEVEDLLRQDIGVRL